MPGSFPGYVTGAMRPGAKSSPFGGPLSLSQSSGAFSPGQVAGLQLWLVANSLVLNNADPVPTWTDSSGQGNTASQGTGSKQPTYRTNILNGQPSVRFDGVDDFLTLTAALTGTTFTAFEIWKPSAANGMILGGAQGIDFVGVTPFTLLQLANFDGFVQVSLTLTNGTPYLLEYRRNGTNVQFYQGASQVGTDQTLPGNTASSLDAVGAYDNGVLPRSGDLMELLFYNTALSVSNRQLVENYLRAKYGI